MTQSEGKLSRRQVLKTGGATALASVTISACDVTSPDQAPPPPPPAAPPENPTVPAKFFTDKEHDTAHALVSRIIPADASPGAGEACVADFIDAFLAAFMTTPPFIYAGAPFSGRGGSAVNEFMQFIPLDAYEERGWREVVEYNQFVYRTGLAKLNTLAEGQGAACFSELSTAQQDSIINDDSDADVARLMDHAIPDTYNGMYGPPEYLGNKNLVGWGFTAYDGDVQPRGYTAEQVVNSDNPQPTDATLPPSYHDNAANKVAYSKRTKPGKPVMGNPKTRVASAALPVIGSADDMSFIMANCEGKLSKLREMMAGYRQHLVQTGAATNITDTLDEEQNTQKHDQTQDQEQSHA